MTLEQAKFAVHALQEIKLLEDHYQDLLDAYNNSGFYEKVPVMFHFNSGQTIDCKGDIVSKLFFFNDYSERVKNRIEYLYDQIDKL